MSDTNGTNGHTQQQHAEDFFHELNNSKPYLKVAFEGFAGSGKTFTMAALAIGLHQRIRSQKPIVAFDTEEALQALKPVFDAAGIRVLRKSSRSLADLIETMRRVREGAADILLIDSITHIWEDVLSTYQKKKNRTRLQFEDWSIIKPTWKREFSDPFVRDPYHCLMTGRAGFEYSDEKDEDGKRQIYKSGIKMKVEGETAYEPDMLVLMERFEQVIGHDKRVWREATIIKDRSTLIDGKTFQNPTFDAFAPAIDRLLQNPDYTPPKEQDASHLFGTEEDRKAFAIRRDIALEKIEGELTSAWPGSSAEAKRAKVEALRHAFGTTSWTEIQRMKPEQLEDGLASISALIQQTRAAAEAQS